MKNIQLFLIFLLGSFSLANAQTTITIGTSTQQNSTTSYPAPYGNWYHGAKHQMLIQASELISAGAGAGNISALAFDVATVEGTPLSGFTIKMKNTTSSAVVGFETGLTTVYSVSSYTENSGWNTHTFSTPFYWDGTSNLLVETCFDNSAYTLNAVVNQSTTNFNSTVYYRADLSTVCSSPGTPTSIDLRPNMKLTMQPAAIPPVANFNASSTNSCSTTISFYDQSTNNPTSWLWDFGDGNTSTLQNPTHTYAGNGTYTVSLTATNQYGSDTQTNVNYITISISGNSPIAASCTPVTQDGSLGFGITNFTLNTINSNTGDASEGYTDLTCSFTTLYVGHTYNYSVTHSTPTNHNCAAWIDYNNDGTFDPNNEVIFTDASSLVSSGSFTVSSSATLNTPLRLRVIADYELSAFPTPCGNPDYGQAEDYTVVIELDSTAPTSSFTSDVTLTCSGVVSFTDQSTNLPYSWDWDFGDGGSSIQQNPTHTYTTDGTYTVSLIATNNFGSDDTIMTNLITVTTANDLVSASCSPQTLSACCGYGIFGVQLGSINYYTAGSIDGYQDYSCEQFTQLTPGNSYPLIIRTGAANPQDTRVWIDYNNDGIFDNTEMIMESLNSYDPQINYIVPSNGITQYTRLRMRVASEQIGSSFDACTNLTRGQVEDYAVEIMPLSVTEEVIIPLEVFIYPNPTEGLLQYSATSSEKIVDIAIYDLIGKQVFHISDRELSNTLDVNYLPTGTYIIQFISEKGNKITNKFIKK